MGFKPRGFTVEDMTEELAANVSDALAVETAKFEKQARKDADYVKDELQRGTFDNNQSIIGLEYEFYAVTDGRWTRSDSERASSLMRVPRRLLNMIGFERELGLHNAEMLTSPQPLNAEGLSAQESEVRARLRAALDCTKAEGIRLVSDGLWTVAPTGESARRYLCDSIEDHGIRIATNMSNAVRYHAMANGPLAANTMQIDAPHVSLSADTVMPESLITSIQPHFQVAYANDLSRYFNYALRLAGPVLALSVNSPFFPPELYDEVEPQQILADGYAENRISVFESVLNTNEMKKVRFPRDLENTEDAIDRVAADGTIVPMPVPRGNRFDDNFATLRRKHGTYWRWVRPVFDGKTRSSANARIEFRPLPAQPTVRDSVSLQALFAGLMESLPQREHPVINQSWSTAKQNFYAAVQDGLDANLQWVCHDGVEKSEPESIFTDILAHAKDGLTSAGCSATVADSYLDPLRFRVNHRLTPAGWKIDQVKDELAHGATFSEAISEMQQEYISQQRSTLLEGSFSDWDR